MLRRNAVFRLVAMSFAPLVCMMLVTGCTTMQPPECETDADCAEGQVCEDGVCVEAPQDHKTLITDYQGTQTCLACHAGHATDIMQTAHWNWSGAVDDIAGLEGENHGKVDFVNNY